MRTRSILQFPEFPQLPGRRLGRFVIQSFHLCAFIVIFTLCFHFYIFKGKLGTKFRNLTKTRVPLSNVAGGRLSFLS